MRSAAPKWAKSSTRTSRPIRSSPVGSSPSIAGTTSKRARRVPRSTFPWRCPSVDLRRVPDVNALAVCQLARSAEVRTVPEGTQTRSPIGLFEFMQLSADWRVRVWHPRASTRLMYRICGRARRRARVEAAATGGELQRTGGVRRHFVGLTRGFSSRGRIVASQAVGVAVAPARDRRGAPEVGGVRRAGPGPVRLTRRVKVPMARGRRAKWTVDPEISGEVANSPSRGTPLAVWPAR
jgi:hypothetical protein